MDYIPDNEEERRLLRLLDRLGTAKVTFSVKGGLPHVARYDKLLPGKAMTPEELVEFTRDLEWGEVTVLAEDGGLKVLSATRQVQLGGWPKRV